MYTTCRIYTGASELADLIINRQSEVESLLRPISGFNAYYLIRTEDGFVSVTVCETKEGAEQSNKAAAEFVRANGSGLTGTTPQIYAGPTPVAFATGRAAVTA